MPSAFDIISRKYAELTDPRKETESLIMQINTTRQQLDQRTAAEELKRRMAREDVQAEREAQMFPIEKQTAEAQLEALRTPKEEKPKLFSSRVDVARDYMTKFKNQVPSDEELIAYAAFTHGPTGIQRIMGFEDVSPATALVLMQKYLPMATGQAGEAALQGATEQETAKRTGALISELPAGAVPVEAPPINIPPTGFMPTGDGAVVEPSSRASFNEWTKYIFDRGFADARTPDIELKRIVNQHIKDKTVREATEERARVAEETRILNREQKERDRKRIEAEKALKEKEKKLGTPESREKRKELVLKYNTISSKLYKLYQLALENEKDTRWPYKKTKASTSSIGDLSVLLNEASGGAKIYNPNTVITSSEIKRIMDAYKRRVFPAGSGKWKSKEGSTESAEKKVEAKSAGKKQVYYVPPPGMTDEEFNGFVNRAQAEVTAGTITPEQFTVILKRKGGKVIYK